MDRIDQILNAESTILEPEQQKPLNGFNKEIEYRNVSFAYRPDRIVLKDVNVKIGKGQTVALVRVGVSFAAKYGLDGLGYHGPVIL